MLQLNDKNWRFETPILLFSYVLLSNIDGSSVLNQYDAVGGS
jgi:hypothetical protein